ncbi:MAG: efflux RND transporter periplasmic adaptor subunit [Planctomycetota bacterium]
MRRPFLQALVAAVTVAVGLAVGRWILLTAPTPATLPPRAPRAVPVEALLLAPGDLDLWVDAACLVEPARQAVIAPEQGGRIEAVHPQWRAGGQVKAGDTLVALDPRDATLALAGARVGLALADAEVRRAGDERALAASAGALAEERLATIQREEERWSRLAAEGRAEASRVDAAAAQRLGAALDDAAARTRVAAARAAATRAELERRARELAVDVAELALARTQVVAPFDGVLGGEPPPIGTLVAPGQPLGELVDVSVLRLVAELSEGQAARVRVGAAASVCQLAGVAVVRPAVVRAVAPRADPLTRSVRVEIECLPAPSDQAPPVGATARARVALGALPDALWLPRAALVFGPEGASVFVVEDVREAPPEPAGGAPPLEAPPARAGARVQPSPDLAVARARNVVLGPAVGDGYAVTAGLAAGERVVVTSVRLLGDGARVTLQGDPEPAGARPR